MKKQNNKAFTLVELIVVITILSVLATVAFISFQGYSSSSRDSVRLADLKNISKSFEINRTKDIDFPLPNKKVDISASGTIFQYQGELSQSILESDLNIFDGGFDPVTLEPYGYAVDLARNKFQVIGFLETNENVTNISKNHTFANNSDKYIKIIGDDLGLLLNEDTYQVVIQSGSLTKIDIQNTDNNYGIVTNDGIIVGDNNLLYSQVEYRLKPDISCKSILHNGKSTGDGIYTINPSGISGEEFKVYCDMTSDGGGWMVIAKSYANGINDETKPFNVNFDTIVNQGIGNINNLNSNYFISMEKYSRLSDIDSQKEYKWMARSANENDPWQETLRYNQHSISPQSDGYIWSGNKISGGTVLYNNKPLSTFDNDRDDSTANCAETYGSFGWYTTCHSAHFWSITRERSSCGTGESRDYGGEYYCEIPNSYGPDAVGAYNTWHSLKIMVR